VTLGETAGNAVGPLLGAPLVEAEGVDDGLPFGLADGFEAKTGIDVGEASGTSVMPLLVAGDGANDGLLLALDEGSDFGLLLSSPLKDDGTGLGAEVGETCGIFVGPLLEGCSAAVDGAGEELSLGLDDNSLTGMLLRSPFTLVGKEVGDKLWETTGISVELLLGA
jgi:hypothetical protein